EGVGVALLLLGRGAAFCAPVTSGRKSAFAVVESRGGADSCAPPWGAGCCARLIWCAPWGADWCALKVVSPSGETLTSRRSAVCSFRSETRTVLRPMHLPVGRWQCSR